jgi:Replication-relaxation
MGGNDRRAIVIQERDRQLLRELSNLRVLDREQAKIVAPFHSTTRANSRLLALTNAGLLRRFFLGTSGGGQKALYALSPEGARIVDVPYRGPRRGRDEVLVADLFVTHQLSINEIYCTLKYPSVSSETFHFVRWMSFFETLHQGISLIPDGYAEIANPSGTLTAFLEVDLGSEGRKVWKEKVKEYLRYALSGLFPGQFHQPRFRVLVIVTSERRLQSIRAVVAATTEKIFWFATIESIRRDGFWSPIWLRPRDDERKSLVQLA